MSDATGRPLVSVCVPTYKRPALLELALGSICAQGYAPLEIVVGDDSPDDAAAAVIERVLRATTIPIRYQRHSPRLGQSRNVDDLFRRANGRYVVLLHDDDLLLPDGIAHLMGPILADPKVRVTFGKQNYIDPSGAVLTEETRAHLRLFEGERAVRAVANPIEACLLQQFPNDAYVIETQLAREVGYQSPSATVVAVDADFGIRLGRALMPGEMMFVEAFVASYRRSDDAITMSAAWRRTDHPADAVKLYRVVSALDLPASSEYARVVFLKTVIDALVKGFAKRGDRVTALRLFWSSLYGWRKRLSLRGAYHLALIAHPNIDRLRRYE